MSVPASSPVDGKAGPRLHPRTVGWFGTTCVAMGGANQSLFLIGALFVGQGSIPGQGSAAVPLLILGLLLSWAAIPLAVGVARVVRTRTDGPSLNGALARTGALQLIFCLLFSAGILASGGIGS